ncbi:MAG: FTR1 family iron permease [Chloroflexia bacterium]
MLLAAGILTWVIFWMQRQGREIRVGLEAEVRRVVSEEDRWLLFVLSFVAVLREGLEMALFLTAASFQVETGQIWFGALLGLMVAIGLGWLFLAVGKGLNLRLFFRITSLVLLLFAAGLVGRGIHELQESGMIPTLIEHLWDINPFLDEKGPLGSFLQSLLGYNGNPSLLEVVAYILYLGTVSLLGCRQAADGALRLRT